MKEPVENRGAFYPNSSADPKASGLDAAQILRTKAMNSRHWSQ